MIELAPRQSGITREELRQELPPLLELPSERVLVSPGEPVQSGGRDAARARSSSEAAFVRALTPSILLQATRASKGAPLAQIVLDV